ncbi:MAG TPA: hypothetical protein VEH54_00460, partial [Steroidobacteraceae bacterium]|nr:hypothetical protein [Steroidobacteraceae bacterium]
MTVESLGEQLRELLPSSRRIRSVALCDYEGNVLWLNEGSLGPDEHSLVNEAIEHLNANVSLPLHRLTIEDVGVGLFLAIRNPSAQLVGVTMVIADSKSVIDEVLEKLTGAPVRAVMVRIAVLLKPGGARTGATGTYPMLDLEALGSATPAPDDSPPPEKKPLPNSDHLGATGTFRAIEPEPLNGAALGATGSFRALEAKAPPTAPSIPAATSRVADPGASSRGPSESRAPDSKAAPGAAPAGGAASRAPDPAPAARAKSNDATGSFRALDAKAAPSATPSGGATPRTPDTAAAARSKPTGTSG